MYKKKDGYGIHNETNTSRLTFGGGGGRGKGGGHNNSAIYYES